MKKEKKIYVIIGGSSDFSCSEMVHYQRLKSGPRNIASQRVRRASLCSPFLLPSISDLPLPSVSTPSNKKTTPLQLATPPIRPAPHLQSAHPQEDNPSTLPHLLLRSSTPPPSSRLLLPLNRGHFQFQICILSISDLFFFLVYFLFG